MLASAELVRFMDPPPVAPAPPRSLAAARQLAAAAWALFVVSIVAGILRGPDTFAILLVIGAGFGLLAGSARAAARKGRPAFAAGLIPLAPARDLSEYYAAHAGKIFHRHYVRPRTDLDQEARVTWERAVDAANRIYRSESLRDEAVDADRVAADVPELLWKIIEGLAMISDVRINIKNIVKGYERQHPAVYAKIQAQERHLARGTSQVESRIGKLEMLARVLSEADAARRGEDVLKRLNEVDEKIDDLVASTDETASEVDMAEGLKIDVEANIEMTNQAIRDLSAQDSARTPRRTRIRSRARPTRRSRALPSGGALAALHGEPPAHRIESYRPRRRERSEARGPVRVELGPELAEVGQARVHLLERRRAAPGSPWPGRRGRRGRPRAGRARPGAGRGRGCGRGSRAPASSRPSGTTAGRDRPGRSA